MILKINGAKFIMDNVRNLAELVDKKGLHCDRIVIEHNFNITKKDDWKNIILNDGDNIEIVSFVGGG